MVRNVQNNKKATKDRIGYFRLDEQSYQALLSIAQREDIKLVDVLRRAVRLFLKSRHAA